jgi:hypothetical protein
MTMLPANQPIRDFDRSRRRFLGGVGAALALPWLESFPVRAAESGKLEPSSSASGPPTRFACIYFSNGVAPEHWWARGSGATMELGRALEPLLPHRDDFVFLRGLYNQQAVDHPSAHLGRSPNMLSGAWVSQEQDDIRVGRTMDQVLAQHAGRHTPLASLVLGIEPTELRLEDGLSMIYGSCISWASDSKPATKEIYPSRAFDLIVGDGQGRRQDRSILDEVLEDARLLRLELAQDDRRKLDEYLESIRDIETRIDRASDEGRLEGWRPTLEAPDLPRPADSLPQDVPEHFRLMLDLIVLAFQMDKTRIATCMLNNDLSQMNFGFLDGVRGALHLDLTHNGNDPVLQRMYLRTNQYHFQQLAYLIDRMKRIDEGGRSLLDNSLILFGSNLMDGDKHEADEMPLLLAGHGAGLQTGRVLDFRAGGDDNRRACSLFLTLMDQFGVELPRFGDTNRRLTGLF